MHGNHLPKLDHIISNLVRFRWQPSAQHSPAHVFKNFLGPNTGLHGCSCYAQLLRPCGWATLGGSFSLVSTLARPQLGMCEASDWGAINFSRKILSSIIYDQFLVSHGSSDSSFKIIAFSQGMIHWIFALVLTILMLLHVGSLRKVPCWGFDDSWLAGVPQCSHHLPSYITCANQSSNRCDYLQLWRAKAYIYPNLPNPTQTVHHTQPGLMWEFWLFTAESFGLINLLLRVPNMW